MGASFAGLACATALARAGLRVTVLERKADVGEKLHTTGILVKDAVDQIALLDGLPADYRPTHRRRAAVRAEPSPRRSVGAGLLLPRHGYTAVDALAGRAGRAGRGDHRAPDVVRHRAADAERFRSRRWTARRASSSGRMVRTRASRRCSGSVATPSSCSASSTSTAGIELAEPNRLHCFIDRRLAPGYIGWIVAGVGVTQVGLAGRVQSGRLTATEAMAPFLEKIARIVDFRQREACLDPGRHDSVRRCRPSRRRTSRDARGRCGGMVSPVTAGGIHTALKHGLAAGHAIADFLNGKSGDPSEGFVHVVSAIQGQTPAAIPLRSLSERPGVQPPARHQAHARGGQRRLFPPQGRIRTLVERRLQPPRERAR